MKDQIVVVVGLGYVGLPLALAFGRKMQTIGFDISKKKITSYKEGHDPTGEMAKEDFARSKNLTFTTQPSDIAEADFVIVAVPTPVDKGHAPDLNPVIQATELVGCNLKKGAIVIFESTVYPGVTEEVCVPILIKASSMLCGDEGFKVAYSPERVNPGDKLHSIENIIKVVSGQDSDTLNKVAQLYETIIEAGVYRATSIKVAEAAKVIENTQRDLNIALVNELSIIFERIGIDTLEVLEAAGSKWNFLPFRPGLVGGHCIGVDPYYLTFKAEIMGYHPEVILAGRRINDGMPKYVVQQMIKLMIKNGTNIKSSKIVVLGLTFKENCSDLRNSKVVDVVNELEDFGCKTYVHDPLADGDISVHEHGINLKNWEDLDVRADALLLAVNHKEYLLKSIDELLLPLKPGGLVIDLKSVLSKDAIKKAGYELWRL